MRKTTLGAAALAAIVIGGSPAAAQTGYTEHEVHAAVEQIFVGMRTARPDMIRKVFAPDARFAMVDGDANGVSVQSVESWLEAIATSEGRWDERVYDVETATWLRSGRPIRSIWTTRSGTAASTRSSS